MDLCVFVSTTTLFSEIFLEFFTFLRKFHLRVFIGGDILCEILNTRGPVQAISAT